MALNVTLMYPNVRWDEWMGRTAWDVHPYNLGLLAAMIEGEHDVRIIDANFDNLSVEDFSKDLKNNTPDVLGISVITNEYSNSGIIAAETAKNVNPQIKTVVGGVSAISYPKPFVESSSIDYIIRGEGEYVFKDLCNFLSSQGDFPKKGVLHKKDGELIDTGRVEFIEDLDKLPLPAYHLFDYAKYTKRVQRETVDRARSMPYTRIITSRGCPNNCCFCEVGSISGKKSRFRSLENITKEIEWLIQDYGVKSLSFDDDNLTTNRKRAKNLFRTMIDRKYNLKWNDPATAIFTLDDELLDLMKESGCQYLGVAIESGNKRVLKDIIHKPVNLEKVKETVEKIKERNIDLAANFIIGFPGETWEEMRDTLRFAEEIGTDYVRIFIATPLPNTELYKKAKERGYLKAGFDFNKHLWTEGWIETPEFRYQDLKILRAYEWDRINFSSKEKKKKIANMFGVSEERLDEMRKQTLAFANP